MQRRTVGVILISISAFVYGIRYLSAAIFGSNVTSWNNDLFNSMLDYVGNGPIFVSWIALIFGIIYLISAEFDSLIKKSAKNIKDSWDAYDKS
ncbi:hypothetical protein [Paenibacillus sp. L3-i20]|uniref:hypothetical protein n=1 Tax=Paenibacillus sp. L3-i20 TaxID=2905833 RepID=UPI001EDF0E38|nr:hypothetical protein [Paenibacillus sp. L3-i20]GKU79193.1 hypothetical protein L3i20_v235900 [Paenibacillus sp. L3-i20]